MREGQLRVIWISNLPQGKAEEFYIDDINQAKLVMATLSHHDINLGDEMIHSNVGSLEVFEDGEWLEWQDEEGDEVNCDEVFDYLRMPN